jgi:hypothetical protein
MFEERSRDASLSRKPRRPGFWENTLFSDLILYRTGLPLPPFKKGGFKNQNA